MASNFFHDSSYSELISLKISSGCSVLLSLFPINIYIYIATATIVWFNGFYIDTSMLSCQ